MESMQLSLAGSASVRSRTERGVRWLILALAVYVVAGVLEFALLLGAVQGFQASPGFFGALEVVGGISLLLGLIGFWMLRLGRHERGFAHASSLRRSTIAFVLAGVSELLILVTGIVLGYVIYPSGLVISTDYPLRVTPEWVLRTLHFGGYFLRTAFVGLTLLWAMWHTVTGVPRWIALAALFAGTASAAITLMLVVAPVPLGFNPAGLFYGSWFLPLASSGLWLTAYVLVLTRIRKVEPSVGAAAPAG